ncbi:MAG: hypothetical protein DWP94_11750 [Flavobacterium sp.]|nr:MAG: hypothetical protein DWP94_11750 [Flavobacterium sp.]
MRTILSILILCIVVSSCDYFETRKISSETFYDEELKTINWNDVDQYPVFKECEQISEKKEQQNCFSEVLKNSLKRVTSHSGIAISREVNDTVWLKFDISETAQLSVKEIEMDSVTSQTFPLLKQALLDMTDSLKLIAPATKQGIPVRTAFSLPIVIETESL